VRHLIKIAALAAALLLSTLSLAQYIPPDTPEYRMAMAHRIVRDGSYIRMVIENEIRKLPADRQETMRKVFGRPGMQEAMETSLLVSFTNNFTTRELAILEPLYGSPEGVEALRKFDSFHRDLSVNMLQQLKALGSK